MFISLRRLAGLRSFASLVAAPVPAVPAIVPLAGPAHHDTGAFGAWNCPALPIETAFRRSPVRSQSPPYCGFGPARVLARAAYGPAVSACR